ncbi:MAG: hypothetical protein U1E05_22890, partial [Patescibacteria group bacterium]|nr:hypothetical protein [Patescibacteria group bacterium]
PRRIEANVSSRIVLSASSPHVEQRFEYTILHEPAEHFLLEVPKTLVAEDGLQFEVFHEGDAAPVRAGGNGPPAASGTTVVMQVDLREPCIGRCELVLKYLLLLPETPEQGGAAISVPLIAPYKVSVASNQVRLVPGEDRSAEVVDEAWRPLDLDDPLGTALAAELAYGTRGPRERIELRIGQSHARSLGATVVERAWIQTWLIRTEHSDRQDRAVFRLRTNARQLDVELPPGTAMEQVFVWLNSERVETFAMDGNRLYIPLPGDGNPAMHSLELGYHFPSLTSRQGSMAVELPRLGEQVWVQRMYWQLVLPRHEHVVVGPEGFTSESPWGWMGYLYARHPLLEQPELEEWSSAARRTPISQDTNRYLFSASGYPREAVLRTAKRSWIVLGASGLALVAGLVLIYIPAGRHPATLFVAAVAIACVGSLYPAPTLLVAQAASLGLGLTLLAGLLERGVARRRTIPLASGVYATIEGDSTLTQHEAARLGEQTTTHAVALGIGSDLPQDSFP